MLAEWETRRIDGTVQVAEASARPNFLPGLHIAFFRDVTERKRLEAELLNAQKLESLGRLAGGVAHDFNNLLTGITGYASLLLERANGDVELRRDLGEIKRAADRAAELTKQLLAFGRRQVLNPRPLDLNAVVAEVEAAPAAPARRARRPRHPATAPTLGTVRADPGQIEQVLVNLVVNARDAMPDGGTLTIETRNVPRTASSCRHRHRLRHGRRNRRADLRALLHDPRAGRRARPCLRLRHRSPEQRRRRRRERAGHRRHLHHPAATCRSSCRAQRSRRPSRQAHPGSETILLVEDEDVVRDLTRRVLERQGYTVLACADGMHAVALAELDDRRIDLLLTDVVMPGMRGYEVAKRVASTRPTIKILYMSGYAEEALVGLPAFAANALIEKPFAVDALARRVRETLES